VDEKNLYSAHHTTNPFASFASNPSGVSFDTQEKGEKIILLVRQHLVSQIGAWLEILGLLLLPVFIGPALVFLRVGIFDYFGPGQVFWLGVFWYLFCFGFAFFKFLHWYFNVYLLTNERIIDFDYKGVLHIETAYANLNQIQDVSPKIIGFFGTFFHYGNVFVQTAGEKQEFEFHHVAKPDEVARRILTEVRLEASEAPGEIK